MFGLCSCFPGLLLGPSAGSNLGRLDNSLSNLFFFYLLNDLERESVNMRISWWVRLDFCQTCPVVSCKVELVEPGTPSCIWLRVPCSPLPSRALL